MTSFIDFYKNNKTKDWDYYYLSRNSQLTLDYINELHRVYTHPLSSNPNITMDYVLQNKGMNWSMYDLSSNPAITIDDVLMYPTEINWDYDGLSRNPNITLDIIKRHPNINWSMTNFSSNPNITMDMYINIRTEYNTTYKGIFKKYTGSNSDIFAISSNPSITYNDVLKYPDEQWYTICVSQNPSFSLENVLDLIEKKMLKHNPQIFDVCISNLSGSLGVEWDDIISHPEIAWDWDYVSCNPNITWDIIQDNPDIMWYNHTVSANPNITWDIVQDYPCGPQNNSVYKNKYWNYNRLSDNQMNYNKQTNVYDYILK